MHFITFLALAAPALVAATLDPASSNTKGKKPSTLNCESESYTTPITAYCHFNRKQAPKYPPQSRPPSAHTTPAPPKPRPSPSSRQTTNTTRTTVRPTVPAPRIPVRRPLATPSRRTRTTGSSTGGVRETRVGMERLASRTRIRESVAVRTRMGRLFLGVILALK